MSGIHNILLAVKSRLEVSASSVTGSDSGFAPSGPVTSSTNPNVTVVGGSGSFTYNWTYVSGSTQFGVNSATTANTTWSGADLPSGPNVATWRITVTDTITGRTASTDITVTLTWNNLS